MKVCVFGAGAVGGHIAGRLASVASAGEAEISLVARGGQLAALKNRGLRVETNAGTLDSRPRVSDDPAELGPQDVVIVSVKAPSLPALAAQLPMLLHGESRVIFVMNGIPWWYFQTHGGEFDGTRIERLDPDGVIWDTIDPDRVVGAVAYTASTVVEPGVISAPNAVNRLIVGRPDGAEDLVLGRVAAMFEGSGLDVTITTGIRDAVWQKLVTNMIGGAFATLTGSPMGQVLSRPGVYAVAEKMAAEAATIAHALGCDPGDTSVGVQKLSTSRHLQSIAQDLAAGRPMEVDAMFQVPLDLAAKVGVEVPTLEFVLELATQRARAAGLY